MHNVQREHILKDAVIGRQVEQAIAHSMKWYRSGASTSGTISVRVLEVFINCRRPLLLGFLSLDLLLALQIHLAPLDIALLQVLTSDRL